MILSPFGFVIPQATHLPSDPVYSVVKVQERNEIVLSPTRPRNGLYFSSPSLGRQRNELFSQTWLHNAILLKFPVKSTVFRTISRDFFVPPKKALSPIASKSPFWECVFQKYFESLYTCTVLCSNFCSLFIRIFAFFAVCVVVKDEFG